MWIDEVELGYQRVECHRVVAVVDAGDRVMRRRGNRPTDECDEQPQQTPVHGVIMPGSMHYAYMDETELVARR